MYHAYGDAAVRTGRLISGSDRMASRFPQEMVVDGGRGKTYRVEVTGDPERDANFTLNVTYRITCES